MGSFLDAAIPDTPKLKRKRKASFKSPVPTTCLNRILDMTPYYEEGREMRGMYASQLVWDRYTSLGDVLQQYWSPPGPSPRSWWTKSIVDQGNLFHDFIQHGMWKAGVLHPLHNGEDVEGNPEFQEVRANCPYYNVRGRIDMISVSPAILKAVGAKTPKEVKKVENWTCGDVKTVWAKTYDEIEDIDSPCLAAKIDKYKAQITFYFDYLVKQGLVDKDSTPYFLFVSRDDIRKQKYVEYKPEERIRDLIQTNITEFWGHVVNRTHPEIPNFDKVIDLYVKEQPDREFTLPEYLGK